MHKDIKYKPHVMRKRNIISSKTRKKSCDLIEDIVEHAHAHRGARYAVILLGWENKENESNGRYRKVVCMEVQTVIHIKFVSSIISSGFLSI